MYSSHSSLRPIASGALTNLHIAASCLLVIIIHESKYSEFHAANDNGDDSFQFPEMPSDSESDVSRSGYSSMAFKTIVRQKL